MNYQEAVSVVIGHLMGDKDLIEIPFEDIRDMYSVKITIDPSKGGNVKVTKVNKADVGALLNDI